MHSLPGYGTLNAGLLAQGTATINGGAALTVNGDFENDGTLTISGDTNLIINVPVDDSGSFVNNGTMTIDGGSALIVNMPGDGSGSFVNNGLLDIMDSPQTALPTGYVNNGTILTSALGYSEAIQQIREQLLRIDPILYRTQLPIAKIDQSSDMAKRRHRAGWRDGIRTRAERHQRRGGGGLIPDQRGTVDFMPPQFFSSSDCSPCQIRSFSGWQS